MQLSKVLFSLLAVSASLFAQQASQTVWQIGKFDQSPLEFSGRERGPVQFEIGKSDWKSDWQPRQGINNPYKILFPLSSTAGAYTLKITALIEQPRVPTLQISINDHRGTFFFRPHISYYPGDFTFAFDPHESESTLEIQIPPAFLKAGTNTMTLTGVDDPPPAPGEEKFSEIVYDALSLEQNFAKAARSQEMSVDVKPTIFYRQTNAGLAEIVDCYLRSDRPWKTGSVELEVNGNHYQAKLAGDAEFGEQRVSFAVPEWSGTSDGKLRVGGHSWNVQLMPERKWTVFVVPHTHLDVGFTDYQGKVAETQPRVLTQAADLIRQYPDFRFSMDGSWNLQQLLETRPPAKQKEMLDLIRNNRMALPAQYCNLLTGYASLETLYRSLYKSKALADQYNLPFEYANITDVPTYSGSYPSVLASSGVKYWVAAANNDRAPIFHFKQWNEQSPFWWEGPDGKRVLFWYSRHYMQVQTLFGLPPGQAAIRESLPIYLQAYSHPEYKPDVALIYGTQVENTDLFPTTATFATEWNRQYAYPKLQYATFPDFFHYVDQHYSATLPVYKGDGGPYWEDGIGSDAYFAAEDRQNQNRALSAEVLSSVTHTVDPNLNPPAGIFEDIWRNIILFAEHTWLSYNSISQPDHEQSIRQARVKDDRAERAALGIEDVINRSLSQLADQIHIPANTLVVFNSLNWQRDALVETDLFDNPQVVDLTTQESVPLEILSAKEKFLHVRFLAKNLPAVGYKCYRLTYGTQAPPAPQRLQETTVENDYYRVQVDPVTGSLASLYDKQLGRELADTKSPYKFGQYVYVTGGDGSTKLINPFSTLPPGHLEEHGASNGKYLGVEHLPWGDSLRLVSSGVHTPKIKTEILLFKQHKKVEFHYSIQKSYTNNKEGVYIAFPLGSSSPRFAYSAQQGWLDPAKDLMKGASLEWFNIQYWMAAHDDNAAVGIVPVDTPLASFGDIFRGRWLGDFQPKSSAIFSYAMNNYWHTNYRAGQGGDFQFRYVLTSKDQLDGGALTRLGMEEMRPVEVNYVVDQDKAGNPPRPLPPEGKGFLTTEGGDITLLTWKAAEDGKGSILRFVETAGKQTKTSVRFPTAQLISAQLCSGVEENREALPVENNSLPLSLKPFEVVTVRVAMK
ncbi:MAG: polysaccharide lyase family protein [Bryobacteraceae bacterium]